MNKKRKILLLSATEVEHGETSLFDYEIHITVIGKINAAVNTAYLFKSKGTLRAIESLLNIAGIPKSLIEMSESVYLVDNPININNFNDF